MIGLLQKRCHCTRYYSTNPITFPIFAFMLIRLIYSLLFFFIFIGDALAQNYPIGDFIPPLDGTLQLSGTFAELRSNHFHSGIDLRTGGKEGLPVKACADGYVVRIKISPFGFGKALYINHPNGFTTVYAHLQGFNPAIDQWVKEQQYKLEQFEVDLFPPRDLLRVKQGEIIARSGNSGSSEGPHVHFEVRETKSEFPVDPLLFGFPVKDFIRPTMHGLRVYPEGRNAEVNDKKEPLSLTLAGWGPGYRLKITDTIEITGNYSLGISASDLLNETSNRNGIVRYAVYVDSLLQFEWKATRFSFAETRYINSFIDFPHYHSTNQRFMRTHIAPGNQLGMYSFKPSKGVFTSIPGKVQQVNVVISDSKANESNLKFFVKGVHPAEAKSRLPESITDGKLSLGLLFTREAVNTFSTPYVYITLPGKCLYDSIRFNFSQTPSLPGMLSPIYIVHDPSVALHDYYDFKVRVDSVNGIKPEKLLVVKLNSLNKPSAVGGKYENGFLSVKLREFGRFAVMADTIAPIIKALNIREGMQLNGLQEIRINIGDNLSGINTYRATLNGKWIIMDYDAKNRLLTYKKDKMMLPGENILVVEISDRNGNNTTSQWKIFN